MAHMWFGNIVTMRWWDDLWLNEAFAEFAAQLGRGAAPRGSPTPGPATSPPRSCDAYLADQGPTSHPIRQPIRDVDEAASIFDAITYPKGASVLQQLMTYVGEERFAAGMTDYFAKPRLGEHRRSRTSSTRSPRRAAATWTRWREGWLETAGTDRL